MADVERAAKSRRKDEREFFSSGKVKNPNRRRLHVNALDSRLTRRSWTQQRQCGLGDVVDWYRGCRAIDYELNKLRAVVFE